MRRYLLLPSALPLLLLTLHLQQQPAVAPPPPPIVTTAPCQQLDGLKCAPEALPCAVDESGMSAEVCRRRRREQAQTASVGDVNDCAGSAYASKDAEGRWYCGASRACVEWVAAAGWTTVALNGNTCPTVPASDSPFTMTAALSETTQSQGHLVLFTVELSRPASGGRRRLHRPQEQQTGRALWGNAKSKVPANYALRLDLPSRLNATVKHVGIYPSLQPWSDKTPQVVGEDLLWPRVPVGQQTKRRTKRRFKVLVRIGSGVSNLGPMPFAAVAYRLENGVATDLRQASATVQVTAGTSLLGGK